MTFIRFARQCSAAYPATGRLTSAYPASAHQWTPRRCRPFYPLGAGIRTPVALVQRGGCHGADRTQVVKALLTFAVDFVGRYVGQRFETGGELLLAIEIQLGIRLRDTAANGKTQTLRRDRVLKTHQLADALRVNIREKNVFLITGSGTSGCGIMAVGSSGGLIGITHNHCRHDDLKIGGGGRRP